jgi:hypothetical protein
MCVYAGNQWLHLFIHFKSSLDVCIDLHIVLLLFLINFERDDKRHAIDFDVGAYRLSPDKAGMKGGIDHHDEKKCWQ